MSLQEIKDRVDARQARTIAAKATAGDIRALELLWTSTVREVWQITVPAFTAQARGNMRHFLTEYPNAAELIPPVITGWARLRQDASLKALPATPYFLSFFAHRAAILGIIETERRRVTETTAQVKALQTRAAPAAGRSLKEVLKEHRRKKYYEQREAAHDPTE